MDTQSGRRKEAAATSMEKNKKQQKAAKKEVERLRDQLAPLDQTLVERQAALEEKNADKYQELHAQQEFMSQLETHITTLGSELQDLRNLLEAKENEYNDSNAR